MQFEQKRRPVSQPVSASQPRLLDRVREALRRKHYSIRTEEAYVDWIKRYIFFHNKRHPAEMGAAELEKYLNHLAVERKVAPRRRIRPSVLSSSSIATCSTLRGRRAEGEGQRAKGEEQRAEGKGQGAKGSRQTAEGKGRKNRGCAAARFSSIRHKD